ncbi:MAG TPA: FtsX-like permease family protein [Bacteroides sp.]|nr:FtsX-like permease family protein [Bacteroides sp.]
MLRNYLTTALRYLLKNPVYAFINVFGLSIGLTCALLILLFIKNEFSYDRFHVSRDNLHRLVFEFADQEGEIRSPQMTAPVGPDMVAEFPEVIRASRFTWPYDGFLSYDESAYTAEKVMYADSTFFQMFSFNLLRGDPNRSLSEPWSLVLGEEIARNIFGEEDPIGKIVRWNNRDELTVTGIVEKPPSNSHFQFHSLISFSSKYLDKQSYMGWNGGMQYYHYLELVPGANAAALEAKFPDFMYKNINHIYEESGSSITAFLQSISRVHLNSGYVGEMGPTGNMNTIYIYSAIALFILFIACINFMNLTTAMATKRAREVGMRKVFGAGRSSLIRQFLGESIAMSMIGLVLALVLIEILLPSFEQIVSRELELYQWRNIDLLIGIPALMFVVGLLAGSYPAFYLSAFKPTAVLKGIFRGVRGYTGLRNSLVFFQFAISIILIICTLVIYVQLGYIRSMDVGYRKDDVIALQFTSDSFKSKYFELKEKLAELPDILSTSATSEPPGAGFTQNGYRPEGYERSIMFYALDVDYDYVSTMGLQVIQGRWFSQDFSTDQDAYLVNETLAKQLGWEDPVGKTINRSGDHIIIGVVKDFQFASVHSEIGPLIFTMKPYSGFDYMMVRFNTANLPKLMAQIERAWKNIDPNEPFEYTFMDEVFDEVYRSEQQMSKLLLYVAIMAILIACMGLFGLALYSTQQRTREIGVRKVYGSTVTGVMTLLSGRFTRWVILANILALPVAYIIMKKYMQIYAYRINFPVWIFLVTALGVYLVALLTIGYQSYKAGNTNPGGALRYE